MTSHDDKLYLIHITECIVRIQEYTAEGKDSFMQDRKTQDAVVRNLQTMAESTQRLSSTLKSKHNDVEWRDIAAFRNILVHDYLGVDLNQVWQILENEIPDLKGTVQAMLAGWPD